MKQGAGSGEQGAGRTAQNYLSADERRCPQMSADELMMDRNNCQGARFHVER
ncbi:MAG: hypothetical protein ABSF90_04305 [Syntrophobacteraceae bacterium]|jgi:hypothetical protein